MKKMARSRTQARNALFILLVVALFVLSACGATPEKTAVAPQADTGEKMDSPTQETAVDATVEATAEATTEATAAADSTPTEAAAASAVSFSNDVLPLLQSQCTRCHGESKAEEGLRLDSFEMLMAGAEDGAVIVPGDAANSLLVQLVESGQMPRRSTKLSAEQIQLLVDWINQGANNN